MNTLDWVNQTFRVGPGDRILFTTSLSFDLSVYDIFGTLAAGACIRVATELGDNNTRVLLESILKDEEDHIDWLEMQQGQIKQMGLPTYLLGQLD